MAITLSGPAISRASRAVDPRARASRRATREPRPAPDTGDARAAGPRRPRAARAGHLRHARRSRRAVRRVAALARAHPLTRRAARYIYPAGCTITTFGLVHWGGLRCARTLG